MEPKNNLETQNDATLSQATDHQGTKPVARQHTPTASAALESRSLLADLTSNPSASPTLPVTPPTSPNPEHVVEIVADRQASHDAGQPAGHVSTAAMEPHGLVQYAPIPSFYLKLRQYGPPSALALTVLGLGMIVGSAAVGPSNPTGQGLLGGGAASVLFGVVDAGLSFFCPCKKTQNKVAAQAPEPVNTSPSTGMA